MSQIKRALAALTQPRGAIHGASAIAVKARGYWGSSASDGAASDRIPLVHRVAILYLILPVAVWLVGWFEWWFGVPAAVLLALGLSRALVPSRGEPELAGLLLSSALGAAAHHRRPAAHLLRLGDDDCRRRSIRRQQHRLAVPPIDIS